MNKNKLMVALFWVLVMVSLGIIGYEFFECQEQPMENKIVVVFSTFIVCAVLFRQIGKRAEGERVRRWTSEAIEWSDTGVSAVLLAFFIMSFIVQAFKIPSGSMIPTLLIEDHLFVNKFVYGTQLPFTMKKLWNYKDVKFYDVVVFLCPPAALSEEDKKNGIKKDFIKRAIGMPGDTIEIKNKVLYINGNKVDDKFASYSHPVIYFKPAYWKSQEEYQKKWEEGSFVYLPIEAIRDNFGPVKVPPENYFVMGDNRDGSFDSRFWGPLPGKFIKGRAWLVYWPFSRFKVIH